MKIRTCIYALTTALLLTPLAGQADVYKFVDKYGRVEYTNLNTKKGGQRLVKTWKGWVPAPRAIRNSTLAQDRVKYAPIIEQYAAKFRLPLELVHAVITAESGYNKDAVSRAGATGLMQLMPATAKRFGVLSSYDATQNIAGGTEYLRWLLDFFGQNVTLAVAGYNAGENAVVKYSNKIPPYAETQEYVRRVTAYQKEYAENGIEDVLPSQKQQSAVTLAAAEDSAVAEAAAVVTPASGSAPAGAVPKITPPKVSSAAAASGRSGKRVATIRWSKPQD